MAPRQVMIMATHCNEGNDYEYESNDKYTIIAFDILYNKGMLEYIDNRIWVDGVRIKLTKDGINTHIWYHTPIKGRMRL